MTNDAHQLWQSTKCTTANPKPFPVTWPPTLTLVHNTKAAMPDLMEDLQGMTGLRADALHRLEDRLVRISSSSRQTSNGTR